MTPILDRFGQPFPQMTEDPAHQRERRVLPAEDLHNIQRFMRLLMPNQLGVGLFCLKCKKSAAPTGRFELGQPVLECGCTAWELGA